MITRLGVLVFAAGFLALGCGKKESTPDAPAAPATTNVTVNGAGVAVREEDGITRYGDEGPEAGAHPTRRFAIARKAADQTSEIVGRLGPNTMVTKKARHGGYYLVDFPGAAGVRPGWIQQDDLNGPVVPPPVVQPTVATPGGRPPPVGRR